MANDLDSQVYNLTMQELVTMFIIDFNPVITFSPAPSGIMHLSSYKNGASALSYGGNSYDFVGIKGSGFRSEINGALPEPQLVIDKNSLTGLAQYQTIKSTYASETGHVFFDWRGAKVTRIRTTSNYLGVTTKQDVDYYLVDQLTRTTKDTIELKLTVSTGADRVNNQSVQELAPNRCALRYRTHNGTGFDYTDEDAGGCPWGNPTTKHNWSAVPNFGTDYFTESNASTVTASQDQCQYSVKGCQVRFDPAEEGLVLPFLGLYKDVSNDSSKDPG